MHSKDGNTKASQFISCSQVIALSFALVFSAFSCNNSYSSSCNLLEIYATSYITSAVPNCINTDAMPNCYHLDFLEDMHPFCVVTDTSFLDLW